MRTFRPAAESLEARSLLTATPVNPVLTWNSVAMQAIRVTSTTPAIAARDLAIVQVSVYDTVNSIVPTGKPYLEKLHAAPGTALDAAIAGAAYESLVKLFPTQSAALGAAYEAALTPLVATLGETSVAQGITLGTTIADAELAARSGDGSTANVPYTPGTAPGQWVPTPPAYKPALLPGWGKVEPFVLKSGSQFRPAPPPALNSPAYLAALRTVESIGAKNSTTRTADQTQIALFWSDGAGTETPPGHWNTIAATVAVARHDSTVKDARVFALLDLALADAGIACWDAKYTYNFWRPITAIQQTDPAWTPLITTPNFPSYLSGHSTFSAAAAKVLSSIYGDHVKFTVGSDGLPGASRSFTSFAQAAAEAGISRIYGGIHFPFDNTAGLALGKKVGKYVVLHALKPLP